MFYDPTSTFFAKARKYNTTREAALDRTEVPEEVYDNLIEAVHNNLDKMYKYVIFDLDGTLSDPSRGFIEGCKYAFSKINMPCEDDESLKRFIGPALFIEWQKCYGFSPEEARRAVMYFREYYSVYGWWNNTVYPGVKEMLEELKARGKKIILSTSKPEVFARSILEKFDLIEYFDFIGANAGTGAGDVQQDPMAAQGGADRLLR